MRLFYCLSLATLLMASASMSAPPRTAGAGEPPEPFQAVQCGQTAVGEPNKPDRDGLTVRVITECEETRRISIIPIFSIFGKKPTAKCDITRTKVRFQKTQDGTRDYRITGSAPARNCCGKAVEGLVQVEQVCR